MDTVDLQEKDGAVTFRVRVQPRASRDEAAGEHNGAIKLRITAPPVDGRANEACRRLIAKLLGVSPSAVEILSGDSSRDKLIRVHNASAALVRARLLG
jgi:uncharacterized protein (TIGR00251 family)